MGMKGIWGGLWGWEVAERERWRDHGRIGDRSSPPSGGTGSRLQAEQVESEARSPTEVADSLWRVAETGKTNPCDHEVAEYRHHPRAGSRPNARTIFVTGDVSVPVASVFHRPFRMPADPVVPRSAFQCRRPPQQEAVPVDMGGEGRGECGLGRVRECD